jgi:hypothetical protein
MWLGAPVPLMYCQVEGAPEPPVPPVVVVVVGPGGAAAGPVAVLELLAAAEAPVTPMRSDGKTAKEACLAPPPSAAAAPACTHARRGTGGTAGRLSDSVVYHQHAGPSSSPTHDLAALSKHASPTHAPAIDHPPPQLEEPSTARPQDQVGVKVGASAALPGTHLGPKRLPPAGKMLGKGITMGAMACKEGGWDCSGAPLSAGRRGGRAPADEQTAVHSHVGGYVSAWRPICMALGLSAFIQ